MTYVNLINALLKDKIKNVPGIVLFGQNIAAGSFLSGLTKDIRVSQNSLIINTPNSENTLVGLGMGMMLNGLSSVFFMKQLDFLLLGCDHLVNTYNFVRIKKPEASFTVFAIVVDSGFQGLQSSLNNMVDFCSLGTIPSYTINNSFDAQRIIASQLISPGFRIIGVSQRLWQTEVVEPPAVVYAQDDNSLFQYAQGDEVTVVCFNFSFSLGLELTARLKEQKIGSSLFTVNFVPLLKWGSIIADVKRTRKVVIIDDSKSINLPAYNLLASILSECKIEKKIMLTRQYSDEWLYPTPDELKINYEEIIKALV